MLSTKSTTYHVQVFWPGRWVETLDTKDYEDALIHAKEERKQFGTGRVKVIVRKETKMSLHGFARWGDTV